MKKRELSRKIPPFFPIMVPEAEGASVAELDGRCGGQPKSEGSKCMKPLSLMTL